MQKNIKTRTIFCKDNLEVLRGINSETIDLIYLDPPFNKKKEFTAPIGSSAEGASFKDWFTLEDIKDEWVKSIKQDNEKLHNFLMGIKNIDGRNSYNFCYIAYMAIRLIECYRILKNTGSVYLHCDPTMSHYLKITLDCIFSENNFRNEIIWSYRTGGTSNKWFSKKHDIILLYSKSDNYKFNILKEKAYTKSENRKAGIVNYGAGKAEFHQDKLGVYNWVNMRDIWEISYLNSQSKERTGYPTQKPLELLERIIKTSSDESDIVLDPFCGCATTCVASERQNRKWIGADISIKAYELVKERMNNEINDEKDMFKYKKEVYFSTEAPKRTDDGKNTEQQKYVYVVSNKAYPGEYKVGIAKNLKQRINSYQTSDPNRAYKEEFNILTPEYEKIEQHIHNIFENKHEWVRADLQDIIKQIKQKNKTLCK